MQQLTFIDAEYNLRKKKTRREEFLDTMDQMIPWKDWILMSQPYYPSGKHICQELNIAPVCAPAA